MTPTFDTLWQLFADHGSSDRRRHDAFHLWNIAAQPRWFQSRRPHQSNHRQDDYASHAALTAQHACFRCRESTTHALRCRRRLGTVDAVWQAKHRGYMSYAMANLFTDYCITGWRIC